MINSLSEQLPLKTIGIVLTDDYYTYLGIVLIQGVWKGFKALMQHYPHARRIWLTRRDIGKLYPHGCDRDPDIDPDLAKPVFIEHFIKYACANDVAVGEIAPLTKKEEELLWHFLYKKSKTLFSFAIYLPKKSPYLRI